MPFLFGGFLMDNCGTGDTLLSDSFLALKALITTAADDNFCSIFPSFRQKEGMRIS